jgi:acetyltransferase-like isoleucine patch superfamily enzyme
MRLFKFLQLELLRRLSDWEFRYFKDNRHTFLRRSYARALGIKFQQPFALGLDFYLRDVGNLQVGRNCSFGSFTKIWNYSAIEIGDDFLGAGCLTINTGTHDPVTLVPATKPIRIGHRVWVGVNVTILSGVEIGDDCVIAAGSVVTTAVPSGSIFGGVPAKEIGTTNRTSPFEIWRPWG